jgi:nucleoside-diphosphate-sugar epimerase
MTAQQEKAVQEQALDELTVAVTGASGFIGGRIVELLTMRTTTRTRALVRGYGRVARLAAWPQDRLEFHLAPLDDPERLCNACTGADVLVHAAFGSSGDVEQRWQSTVAGTKTVLEQAKAAGVRRVVHLSTIDVYDARGLEVVDEQSPALPRDETDRGYEQQKLVAEELALAANGADLEVVVVQPTVVYGPWAGSWTEGPLTRLPEENALLPSGAGHGVCNAVYIDDVADAVLRAVATPDIGGQRFIISGQPIDWGEYYDAFRAVLGLTTNGEAGTAVSSLPDWERGLYVGTAVASTQLAGELLGYSAQTSFQSGMALVADWAAWMGHAPGRNA